MKLPPATHLQFKILLHLKEGEIFGRHLRKVLFEEGLRTMSGPAFYQAMNRLVDAGFAVSRVHDKVVMDTPVSETSYSITSLGRGAIQETLKFYLAAKGTRPSFSGMPRALKRS